MLEDTLQIHRHFPSIVLTSVRADEWPVPLANTALDKAAREDEVNVKAALFQIKRRLSAAKKVKCSGRSHRQNHGQRR